MIKMSKNIRQYIFHYVSWLHDRKDCVLTKIFIHFDYYTIVDKIIIYFIQSAPM
jgi:hypothetical protein